jgi:hypothetical protein
LREAFARMGHDREFQADAMKFAGVQYALEPIPAEEVVRIVRETVRTPAALVERVRKAMDLKESQKGLEAR